jgi:hypothetical protein
MLREALLTLIAPVPVLTLAAQVPLGFADSNWHWQDEDWSLGTLPNPNATDHLVFETVHSLLQHWPNTRMRNGKPSVRSSSAFPRTHVLQVITSYREAFRLEQFSTMERRPKTSNYHRVQNGLLQILNIRISSAGMNPGPVFPSKDAGISRSRPLDPSKSYISTATVLRSFHLAQWIHKTLSHRLDQAILTYTCTTKRGGFKSFVNGERTLVWMAL